MLFYSPGEGWSDLGCYVFLGSGRNTGDGSEMEEQALFGALPDPLYLAKGRGNLALGAKVAMERNAETVGLVTDMLQDFQGLRIPVDEKRIRVANADYFLQPLGKADDSQPLGKPELCKGLVGSVKLAFSTINDYELRKVVGSFCKKTGITPVNHLLH